MYRRGQAHAKEARLKGVNVLLGPSMGPLGRMPVFTSVLVLAVLLTMTRLAEGTGRGLEPIQSCRELLLQKQ